MLVTPDLTPPTSNPNASGLARRATNGYVTTLTADILAAGATIPLASTTGLSADTAVTIVIAPKTDKQEVVIGFPESNNLVNAIRGLEGTAYDHSAGTVVMMHSTAIDHNSLIDFLFKAHKPDGSLKPASVNDVVVIPPATPAGAIMQYAAAAAPTGWLLAQGQIVAQADYPALYTAIAGLYNNGSEGTGNFRLPNLKGAVPVGLDAGQTEFNALGKGGGAKSVNLNHAHSADVQGYHAHSGTTSNGNYNGGASNVLTQSSAYSPPGHNHTFGTDVQGGHGHNISGALGTTSLIQPYVTLNYIIKT